MNVPLGQVAPEPRSQKWKRGGGSGRVCTLGQMSSLEQYTAPSTGDIPHSSHHFLALYRVPATGFQCFPCFISGDCPGESGFPPVPLLTLSGPTSGDQMLSFSQPGQKNITENLRGKKTNSQS